MSLGGQYLTLSTIELDTQYPCLFRRNLGGGRGRRWLKRVVDVRIRQAVVLLSATVVFVTLPLLAWSQSGLSSGDSSGERGNATVGRLDLTYVRPSPRTTLNHYVFDAFGPYPFLSTAFFAGFDQGTNTPPEWGQGFAGYAERYGSDFGISLVGTSTRYGLAAVFKEDTSYYRCDCNGITPRLRYAMMSTLMARVEVMAIMFSQSPRWWRPMRVRLPRSTGGIRIDTTEKTRSGWAITACLILCSQTLFWSLSTVDPTP